jgi:hypothetical protein
MAELRALVSAAMCGLAACGWLKVEQQAARHGDSANPSDLDLETPICDAGGIAGKRACDGCPDNTATYADQPTLFEGLTPRGSDKKGYCTNPGCYECKREAWGKVVEKRRKAKAKAEAAAARKAKKAGLAVCDECRKVLPDGQDGKQDDGARQKAAKTRAEWFPETKAEKAAVAMHQYGLRLVEVIEAAIRDGEAGETCQNVAEWVLWAISRYVWDPPRPDGVIGTAELLEGGIAEATLAEWWREPAMGIVDEYRPRFDQYDGVRNVPLPTEAEEFIEDLERIAEAGSAAMPDKPGGRQGAEMGRGDAEPAKAANGAGEAAK